MKSLLFLAVFSTHSNRKNRKCQSPKSAMYLLPFSKINYVITINYKNLVHLGFRWIIADLNKQISAKIYIPSLIIRRIHDENCLVSYEIVIYEQFAPKYLRLRNCNSLISISWPQLFIQFRTNEIHPLFVFFFSFSLYLSFSLSYFLGGDCGGRWRNKDTRLGYALSDEQRRNAFIHRRRWWWMRGAHQREPIRSCSRTNEERRGVEGTRGWESGINVARASSTNHSPSDLETLEALSLLFNYLAAPEKRTLLSIVRTPPPLWAPSLVTRPAPREEAVPNDRIDAGPSAIVVTQRGTSKAKSSLINKMTIVSIIHFSSSILSFFVFLSYFSHISFFLNNVNLNEWIHSLQTCIKI